MAHIRRIKRGVLTPLDVNFIASIYNAGDYKRILYMQPLEDQPNLYIVSSTRLGHAPANAIGLSSCWIHRRHGEAGFGATMTPSETPKYEFRFNSLADMVKAHEEALTGEASVPS